MAEGQTTFVDTNVLADAYDRSETRKQPVAQARLDVLWRDRTGALSTQVLQEFSIVATRKLATPMSPSSSPPPRSRSATPSRPGTPSSSRRPGVPARHAS